MIKMDRGEIKSIMKELSVLMALLLMLGSLLYACDAVRRADFRRSASTLYHHGKCVLKPCDEDGRCPVWIEKFSKCYMLDSEDSKKFKDGVGFEWKKSTFEIYIREKYN